jgi:hypothetical protein
MTRKTIIWLLVLPQFAVCGQQLYWQETITGRLQAQSAPAVGSSCSSDPQVASYASRPLHEHASYRRIQLNECGITFFNEATSSSGHTADLVQIRPQAWIAAAQRAQPDNLWHWGSRSVAGQQDTQQLFWLEQHTGQLRSAEVKLTPLQWQPLWSATYQAQHQPWFSTEVVPQRLADEPNAEWLVLPGDSQVPLRLFEAGTGIARQLSLPAMNGSAAVMPQVTDTNQDGVAERIYLLSTAGLLLQYHWQPIAGWQSSVVADLRQSGWIFDVSLQRFSARWPSAEGWLQGEVFVLLARESAGFRLVVLRRPQHSQQHSQQTYDVHDLSNTVDLDKAGWQRPLNSRPVTPIKVVAGVMYLPLSSELWPERAGLHAVTYDQLMITQLFSGVAVASQSLFTLASAQYAPLRLAASGGYFQLKSADHVVVPQVQTVNPACLFCVEPLKQRHLQGQQALAMFRHEQVY